MRKTACFFFFLLFAFSVKAQMTPDEQKKLEEAKAKLKAMQTDPRIAAKMKQAQHMLDSMKANPQFQKQMQLANHNMDSIKKANPSLGNIKAPDINSIDLKSSVRKRFQTSLNRRTVTRRHHAGDHGKILKIVWARVRITAIVGGNAIRSEIDSQTVV